MTSNLSQNVKFGSQIQYVAGPAPINANDLVEIGGPGNEAFTAATIDYASQSVSMNYTENNFSAKAMPGSCRQSVVTDQLANIYLLGLNSGGNLVVYKYFPTGYLATSTILDSIISNAYTAKILPLTNGTFAAVYARTGGALGFVIFDQSINIVVAHTSIASEYTPGNAVYHDAVALAGGGFAVVYQNAAGTNVDLTTYNNAGALIQSATNIQTLSGSTAQAILKMSQLPNGNLVVAMRNTMTPVGTSFVIVTTSAASVMINTAVDATATLGLIELDVIPTSGTFCIAGMTGANVVATVFSQAGALQGSEYSTPNTLNTLTYIQFSLRNDGVQFWLAFIPSAGNGVSLVQIPVTGTNQALTTPLGASLGTTISLDHQIINGMSVVFAASPSSGNQAWMAIGLPDTYLGVGIPYVRTPLVFFGTAAATAGAYWPHLMPGGDWTGIFVYDRQNVSGTYFALQRFETSRIVGIAQNTLPAGSTGSLVTVNVGPGSYLCNRMKGTSGTPFNQGVGVPLGNAGVLFANGATLEGIQTTAAIPPPGTTSMTGVFGSGNFIAYTTPGTYTFTATTPYNRIRTVGGGQAGYVGPSNGGGAGGTSSFGSLISATGGNSGGGGLGIGGQFQAAGGLGGTGGISSAAYAGGGGGASGSLLGPGGPGGNGYAVSPNSAGGGGGGCGGGVGAPGSSAPSSYQMGGAGAGSGTNAGQFIGGPNASGATAAYGSACPLPNGYVSRFPYDQLGGGGGSSPGTYAVASNALPGGPGGPGAGGAAGQGAGGIGSPSNPGQGGVGGGGAGGAGAVGNDGAPGGIGGGGGGTGGAGGNGGGYAEGIFVLAVGSTYTITVGAPGAPYAGHSNAGGPGCVVVEF